MSPCRAEECCQEERGGVGGWRVDVDRLAVLREWRWTGLVIADRLHIVKLKIRPTDLCGVFRGSDAVASGVLTADQLRGPQFRRLYRDVYLPAGVPITHSVRCEGAALVLPSAAVITGRSAATLRGIPLARAIDPVEIVVPLVTRIARRSGLDVRRSDLTAEEIAPWLGIGLATPLRTSLDLLLDRMLPDAVADLDAVLRAGLVNLDPIQRMVTERSDRGIVAERPSWPIRERNLGRSPGCGSTSYSMALSQCRSTWSATGRGWWRGWISDFPTRDSPWSTTVNGTANGARSAPTATDSTGYKPPAGTSCSSPPANFVIQPPSSHQSTPPSPPAPGDPLHPIWRHIGGQNTPEEPDMSPYRVKEVRGLGWSGCAS